jgi:hypothetical protein
VIGPTVARQSLHRLAVLATGPCSVPSKGILRRGLKRTIDKSSDEIDQEVEMPEPMTNRPTTITRDLKQESNATTHPLPKTTHAPPAQNDTRTCNKLPDVYM